MDDFSVDKISELLSSPDVIKNVQSALGQLSLTGISDGSDNVIEESGRTKEVAQIMETLGNSGIMTSVASFLSNNKSERIALLTALRPFLSEEKRTVLDSILQLLKVAGIILGAKSIE